MGMWIIAGVFFVLGMCLAKDRQQRRRFLDGIRAWVLLPLGALVARIRNLG